MNEGTGISPVPIVFGAVFRASPRLEWQKEWKLPWYNTTMNATISIDRAGRLVLPKQVRQQLQLEPGESLEMESFEDHIVLRPVRGNASMHKKEGVWVFRAGAPLKASVVHETIRRVRKEREQAVLGRKR